MVTARCSSSGVTSAQLRLPVVRHVAMRAGRGLRSGMRMRRRERRSVRHVARPKIVEPILARFETRDDRVARRMMVRRRVLLRRRITAPDVAALSASPQVKPPRAVTKTLDAAGAAWGEVGSMPSSRVIVRSFLRRTVRTAQQFSGAKGYSRPLSDLRAKVVEQIAAGDAPADVLTRFGTPHHDIGPREIAEKRKNRARFVPVCREGRSHCRNDGSTNIRAREAERERLVIRTPTHGRHGLWRVRFVDDGTGGIADDARRGRVHERTSGAIRARPKASSALRSIAAARSQGASAR